MQVCETTGHDVMKLPATAVTIMQAATLATLGLGNTSVGLVWLLLPGLEWHQTALKKSGQLLAVKSNPGPFAGLSLSFRVV